MSDFIVSRLWWCMPVIPASQEIEVEGLRSEAGLGKLKAEALGHSSSSRELSMKV
jgi:hypothetical protein